MSFNVFFINSEISHLHCKPSTTGFGNEANLNLVIICSICSKYLVSSGARTLNIAAAKSYRAMDLRNDFWIWNQIMRTSHPM